MDEGEDSVFHTVMDVSDIKGHSTDFTCQSQSTRHEGKRKKKQYYGRTENYELIVLSV